MDHIRPSGGIRQDLELVGRGLFKVPAHGGHAAATRSGDGPCSRLHDQGCRGDDRDRGKHSDGGRSQVLARGDGDGRTARLLECSILAHCGVVPWVSSNLMSDHYNRTRSRYYQRLANASRDGDVDGFIIYAAEGYVDMLREQIRVVQGMQRNV